MPIGSQAWREAMASCPPSSLTHVTFEFRHPVIVDEETNQQIAIRMVTGALDPIIATIEDTAPLNPGEAVQFEPVMFRSEWPKFGEGKIPEVSVIFDNAARYILKTLQKAIRIRADFAIVYREYLANDLTQPSYPATEFSLKHALVNGSRVEGVARLDNLTNMKAPNFFYSIARYPGLQQ